MLTQCDCLYSDILAQDSPDSSLAVLHGCLAAAIGNSAACSEYYAVIVEYDFKKYKSDCLLSWRNSGCLDGTGPAQAFLPAYTGISVAKATLRLESIDREDGEDSCYCEAMM